MSKQREALEAAKEELNLLQSRFLLVDGTVNPDVKPRTYDALDLIHQIDEALKEAERDYYTPAQVRKMILDAYDEGRQEMENEPAIKLLELPDEIKERSLKIAEHTDKIEKARLEIAKRKNDALELVLSATENGKPKYSNDKARNVALESLLKENSVYLSAVDEVGLLESQLKREEIELNHSQNLFRAYLAIAGMQVR